MLARTTCILLLMGCCVVADKQIKLEDIERDNLLSERRVVTHDTLKPEQTQHLRAPQYEVRCLTHEEMRWFSLETTKFYKRFRVFFLFL